MGKYNSSIYRVVPLGNFLSNNPKETIKLLAALNIKEETYPNEFFYGDNEKRLKPSKEHLDALIDYVALKQKNHAFTENKNRLGLFSSKKEIEEAKRLEAHKLLNERYDGLPENQRSWFVFEGFTQPDLFAEAEQYVLLIEGKWTERKITTSTTHLKENDGEYRNQMIRHIEGAINSFPNKKVYACYIVDDECKYKKELTKEALKKHLKLETIKKNLQTEKRIVNSFYGFLTWKDIQSLFPEIEFKTKEEIK